PACVRDAEGPAPEDVSSRARPRLVRDDVRRRAGGPGRHRRRAAGPRRAAPEPAISRHPRAPRHRGHAAGPRQAARARPPGEPRRARGGQEVGARVGARRRPRLPRLGRADAAGLLPEPRRDGDARPGLCRPRCPHAGDPRGLRPDGAPPPRGRADAARRAGAPGPGARPRPAAAHAGAPRPGGGRPGGPARPDRGGDARLPRRRTPHPAGRAEPHRAAAPPRPGVLPGRRDDAPSGARRRRRLGRVRLRAPDARLCAPGGDRPGAPRARRLKGHNAATTQRPQRSAQAPPPPPRRPCVGPCSPWAPPSSAPWPPASSSFPTPPRGPSASPARRPAPPSWGSSFSSSRSWGRIGGTGSETLRVSASVRAEGADRLGWGPFGPPASAPFFAEMPLGALRRRLRRRLRPLQGVRHFCEKTGARWFAKGANLKVRSLACGGVSSPLLVVGTVALDSVETPYGKASDVLGG